MAVDRDEVHTETDEARGGSTPHIVRWILGISILLGIVLLSAVWIFGAATQGDVEEEITATSIAEDQTDDRDTDGLVIDNADELDTFDDTDSLNIPNVTEGETDLGAEAETGQ